MIKKILASAIILLIATACAGNPKPLASENIRPFDIVDYFDGKINGHGVIERSDRIVDRFDMVVEANFKNGVLTLDETFLFDKTKPYRRVWSMREIEPGVWSATADNVKGTTKIIVRDGVVTMNYLADFPYNDGFITLRFNQRLFSMENGMVLNRSRLSKFGVSVGTVTVIFRKA